MEAEEVLAKINDSGLSAEWKRYAREAFRRDAKNIAEQKVEVKGEPAAAVPDEDASWGPRKAVNQILYDRNKSIFINLEGLRRRPYTHTYTKMKWGNPIVWVLFEYCLDDAKAIRERWNAQRPNKRGRSWPKN